jgi:FAD:protein FMN transferase
VSKLFLVAAILAVSSVHFSELGGLQMYVHRQAKPEPPAMAVTGAPARTEATGEQKKPGEAEAAVEQQSQGEAQTMAVRKRQRKAQTPADLLAPADPQTVRRIQITGRAQGTTYSLIYYAADTTVTKPNIDSLLNRLDESLSIYKPGSLINKFNGSSNGIKIDAHLQAVVRKAIRIFQDTDSMFDITIMPLTQRWGFGTTKRKQEPSANEIRKLLPCIGTQHLSFQQSFLHKDRPCIMLDVNGIAQGYSVDRLALLLEQHGVSNYIVELGGEIRVKGHKPLPATDTSGHNSLGSVTDQKMKIGIESPATNEMEAGVLKKIISVDSGAITTSGNYRKYYESKGKIISHLLDPRTGYSINNELISVTVYAPDAITADGYDNALMVMGLDQALRFVEKRPFLAAYFIFRASDGQISDTASSRFTPLFVKGAD